MRKIRVLQLIWGMNEGGAQSIVKDYSIGIDKNRFEIIVVTIIPLFSKAYIDDLRRDRVPIYSVYKHWNKVSKFVHKLFGDRFIKNRLYKIIKNTKPDLIHVHVYGLKHIAKIKMDNNVRIIYTCHGDPDRYFPGPQSEDYLAAKDLLNKRKLTIIALHKKMQNRINEIFDFSGTIVLGNGVRIEKFLPEKIKKSKEELRKSIGVPKDSYVVGHIGRFVKVKNHSFLLKVFSNCVSLKDNCHLLLIGSGELKEDIIENSNILGIADKMTILSNRNDIPELFKCMDIFVLPSITEGFPVTLVEAQAAGLPCIVSDAINEEAVLTSNVKILSLNGGIDVWAEAIIKFCKSNETYNCVNKYDLNNIIGSLETIYSNLVNDKKG